MKSRSFFSFLFVLFSATSFAQEQKFLTLDSLFQILDVNNRFMGSLSISENGKVTYSKKYKLKHVTNQNCETAKK